MVKMGKIMVMHRTGILAWVGRLISLGPMEETSNKIKWLKRQANGYRDQELLKLRIPGIHAAKYTLTG